MALLAQPSIRQHWRLGREVRQGIAARVSNPFSDSCERGVQLVPTLGCALCTCARTVAEAELRRKESVSEGLDPERLHARADGTQPLAVEVMRHGTIELATDFGIERLCRSCGDFWPLNFFAPNKACFRGRTRECCGCRTRRRKSGALEAKRGELAGPILRRETPARSARRYAARSERGDRQTEAQVGR